MITVTNTKGPVFHLSPKTKAADLLNYNWSLLSIMTRMGLKLGFGEATIGDLCRKHGVDVNTFLLVCNVYSSADYLPSQETLDEVQVAQIIRYLRLSHDYYLNSALIYLERGIEKMLSPCPAPRRAAVRKFFDDYCEELRKHFDFEEKNVFSYAEDLLAGAAVPGDSFSEMGDDHSNIEEKVGDLRNIVMKYLPSECETDAVTPVLTYIFHLSEDLERHTFIEDKVLVPMIKRLESEKRGR